LGDGRRFKEKRRGKEEADQNTKKNFKAGHQSSARKESGVPSLTGPKKGATGGGKRGGGLRLSGHGRIARRRFGAYALDLFVEERRKITNLHGSIEENLGASFIGQSPEKNEKILRMTADTGSREPGKKKKGK